MVDLIRVVRLIRIVRMVRMVRVVRVLWYSSFKVLQSDNTVASYFGDKTKLLR